MKIPNEFDSKIWIMIVLLNGKQAGISWFNTNIDNLHVHKWEKWVCTKIAPN